MTSIIQRNRSIIPACDVGLARYEDIVKETCRIPEIGAYKISSILAVFNGLPKLVEIARKYTEKPYLHNKRLDP